MATESQDMERLVMFRTIRHAVASFARKIYAARTIDLVIKCSTYQCPPPPSHYRAEAIGHDRFTTKKDFDDVFFMHALY